MKKQNLKMFLSLLLLLFNVAACFAGTWSWYVSTQQINASSFQLQIYAHELDMSYRVYKYDDDVKSAINVTGQADALVLQEYDSVFEDHNDHTPIIIEFMMTGIDLGEDIPVYINTHCTNAIYNSRYISNIVELKFALINSITSSDPDDIYNDAVAHFQNVEGLTFVEGTTKNQDVVYTLDDYSEDILNGSLRLYIQLDYSVSLIHDNFSFSLSDITTTTFTNDLTMINCYTEGE